MEPLCHTLFQENALLQATLSSPKSPKITIRQIELKGKITYQLSIHHKKILHKNLTAEDCLTTLLDLAPQYKQILLTTPNETYQVLQGKKGNITLLKKPNKTIKTIAHNRIKNTLLKEGTPIPFLVELGVMTPSGKIAPGKRDKFRQINRFLELVSDIVPEPLHIIDFGCGKAYLTFALYHYLHIEKKLPITITGLDLKEDVVAFCQSVANKLQYKHLHFLQGDIATYEGVKTVDLVVCLHACDTATDAALLKAIEWQAKAIMAVPCCQHQLIKQVKCNELHPILKHGVLKERFAALATDAARAQFLEISGYKTQVFEFVDLEHTPKNLMIRAVKGGKKPKELLEEYHAFTNFLNIKPAISQTHSQ